MSEQVQPLITTGQMLAVDLAIQDGSHRKRALKAAGVSEGHYRKALRLASDGINPYHDWIIGLEQAEAKAESSLVQNIAGAKDWRAAAFILERRYPEQWGQKIQVEVKRELEKVFAIAQEVLPEEQFIQLLERISRIDSEDATIEAEEAVPLH